VICSTLNLQMDTSKNNRQPNHKRPRHLNLVKIKMPVTAVVSILHRVSGIVLFLSIPYVVWLLSQSITSQAGFNYVLNIFSSDGGKLINIILLWSIVHHFYAGIRFLLLDIDFAISREATIKMAWLVNILVVVTLILLIFKVVL